MINHTIRSASSRITTGECSKPLPGGLGVSSADLYVKRSRSLGALDAGRSADVVTQSGSGSRSFISCDVEIWYVEREV